MPSFRLGKKPARRDPRTIKLTDVLKVLPPSPDYYSVDANLPKPIPLQMFGNDTKGDCVIAYKANHLERFELLQEGTVLPISTQDCLDEYYREEGWVDTRCPWPFQWISHGSPPDNGLVFLDSMNWWRQKGWDIGGHNYKIHAYASALTEQEIKWGCQYLSGAAVGVQLPFSAEDQFKAGEPWTVLSDDGGTDGGHALYTEEFSPAGPLFITWKKKQQATWDWFNKYRDESYVVVQERDTWDPNSPIDVAKLEEKLAQITA